MADSGGWGSDTGAHSAPVAGWYADPSGAAGLRWWDGRGWTDHTRAAPDAPATPAGAAAPAPIEPVPPSALPAPAPPAPGAPGAAVPPYASPPYASPGYGTPGYGGAGYAYGAPLPGSAAQLLEEERSMGRPVDRALIFGGAAYVLMFIVIAVVYHSIFRGFLDQLHEAERTGSTFSPSSGTTTTNPGTMSGGTLALSGVLQLVQVGLLIVGIMFLVWFHRAAKLAEASPALRPVRTPGLATAGWFIPIVNLWWPYQSTRDLFVVGDPRRRLVGRWWALWLSTQFGATVLLVAAFGPVPLLAGLVVVFSIVAVLAAGAARRVVAAVGDAHAELVTGVPSA